MTTISWMSLTITSNRRPCRVIIATLNESRKFFPEGVLGLLRVDEDAAPEMAGLAPCFSAKPFSASPFNCGRVKRDDSTHRPLSSQC
jgi:hypothetical protein